MNTLRVALYAALMAVGFVPWALAMVLMSAVMWLATICSRVLPDAKRQNCWTYAMPKFHRHGGYLMFRYSDGVRMWGFRFLNCIWLKTLPTEGAELEYFHPNKRRRGWLTPWEVAFHPGHIRTRETPHNAKL